MFTRYWGQKSSSHLLICCSGDSWSYKHHQHFISFPAGPQIDSCFRRPAWISESHLRSSDSALQFGCFQETFPVYAKLNATTSAVLTVFLTHEFLFFKQIITIIIISLL